MFKILIVDDLQDHRDIIRAWLETQYEVTECKSAEEAMRLIQDVKPDCVVLDYRMQGLNGFQFLHVMYKEKIVMPPVIFISADMEEGLKRNAIALGASACFEKVDIICQPEKLISAIDSAIQEKP